MLQELQLPAALPPRAVLFYESVRYLGGNDTANVEEFWKEHTFGGKLAIKHTIPTGTRGFVLPNIIELY